MKKNKTYPKGRDIFKIARNVDFPASRQEVEYVAKSWGFFGSVIDFLEMFPANQIFQNDIDFIKRSAELMKLLNRTKYHYPN